MRRLHSSLTRGTRSTAEDGGSPPPRRHYERGHPLPSNHNPQPKDAIPYRNQHLGLPSQRRHMEFASGCSPQRRMTYSNFRPSDSQSQTCPSSPRQRSTYTSPSRWGESRSLSCRRGSRSRSRADSHVTSHQQSGRCSPTDRHGSTALSTQSGQLNSSGRRTRKGSPCPSSQRHSLDSEKLYNNLTSIAGSQRQSYSTETDVYYNGHGHGNGSANGSHSGYSSRHSKRNSVQNSGSSSPCRRRDSGAHASDRAANYTGRGSMDSRKTYPRSPPETHSKLNPDQSDSSHGSTHSRLSSASPHYSQSPSPHRSSSKQQTLCDLPAAPREALSAGMNSSDRSRSTIRRGLEALILSSSDETRHPDRSTSPPMTFEDYVIIADIPRTTLYIEEGESRGMVRRRPQSQSPQRGYQHQPSRYTEEQRQAFTSYTADEGPIFDAQCTHITVRKMSVSIGYS